MERKGKIRRYLKLVSMILRIMSSKRKINVEEYAKMCKECYLLRVELWPWSSVPESIHRVLGHSAEAIQRNGGYGLGLLRYMNRFFWTVFGQ